MDQETAGCGRERAGELRRQAGPEGVHATLRACHHSWLIVCIDEVENGHDAVRRIPEDIDIES